ncbi:MAG: (Fe-S)-binding protein [Nitrospirae bacterium]|nr:(Fe-S)-binding protein [Nitrospirota bacterium]
MINKEDILPIIKRCVLCGSCKSDCPTYYLYNRESNSPRGRVYLLYCLLQQEIAPSEEIAERIFSCLLCDACEDKCSAGVDIVLSLYYGRALLKRYDPFYKTWGRLLSLALRKRGISYQIIKGLYPLLKGYLQKNNIVSHNFSFEGYRFSQVGDIFIPHKETTKKGRVVLFKGCMVEFIYPHLGEAFVRVANRAGYEVVTLKGEQCCGAPLLGMGLLEETRRLAKKNIKQFRALKSNLMVSLCPTCVKVLSQEYIKIAGEGIEVVDAVSFLTDRLPMGQKINLTALYHDPCHCLYSLGQYDEPRKILDTVGIEVVDYQMGCCGLAGTHALRNVEKSMEMLNKNIEIFHHCGAEILVTSCPGCMFQFMKTLPQEGVFHIIEIIDEYLSEES